MSSLLTFGLGYPAHLMLTFGLGDHGAVPAAPGVYRDDAVMEDAAARLEALEIFGVVICGATPDEQPAAASDSFAVCWVYDEAGQNLPIFTSTSFTERHGLFGVEIEVRHQDPIERRRRLVRLESEVRNALQNKALANACYPGSVKIERQGRDRTVNHPSSRIVLIGRYRFPVGGSAAHDGSDRESAWR